MLKASLFTVVLSVSLFAVPVAMAGGAGCDKSKGHSKELSAQGLKEHGDRHGWLFSDKGDHHKEPLVSEKETPAEIPNAKSEKLIEI